MFRLVLIEKQCPYPIKSKVRGLGESPIGSDHRLILSVKIIFLIQEPRLIQLILNSDTLG